MNRALPTLTGKPLRPIGSTFWMYRPPSTYWGRPDPYLHPMFTRTLQRVEDHVEVGSPFAGGYDFLFSYAGESVRPVRSEIFPAIGSFGEMHGVTDATEPTNIVGYVPPEEFLDEFHPLLRIIYERGYFSPITTTFKLGFMIGYGGENPVMDRDSYKDFYETYSNQGYMQTLGFEKNGR